MRCFSLLKNSTLERLAIPPQVGTTQKVFGRPDCAEHVFRALAAS